MEATGCEHIPEDRDPFILAVAHHASWWDIIGSGYLVYDLTGRPVRFLAKDKFFRNTVLGPLFKSLEALPVNRNEYQADQIEAAINALKLGDIVGVPPEGTRTYGNKIGKTKRGVGIIACLANVGVLPVAIRGKEWHIRQERPFITPPLKIAFGSMIPAPEYTPDIEPGEMETANKIPRDLLRAAGNVNKKVRHSLQEVLDVATGS
jgi:1-acyl-sn-glycerol-3-phosphate acyltransferase